MKRVLIVSLLLLCISGSVHAQKGVRKDYYLVAINAIRANNLAELATNIKHISDIDSLIPLDTYHTYSLLGYACLYKNKAAVQKLISLKANIDYAYSDEIFVYDALYMAINNEDYSLTKQLLSLGADPNKPYNENGLCPLVASCNVNNVAIASLLLKNGAKANGIGNLGGDYIEIPLIAAVMKGNKDMVLLLLKHGAQREVKDESGHSPLFYARQKKNVPIIRMLQKRTARHTLPPSKNG